eukprot:1231584-Alexandrium_andersonii.AAC.1
MSASLVGSEMCIRDSVSATSPSVSEPTSSRHVGRARCCRTTPLARCAYTVSYTHLTLPTICSV